MAGPSLANYQLNENNAHEAAAIDEQGGPDRALDPFVELGAGARLNRAGGAGSEGENVGEDIHDYHCRRHLERSEQFALAGSSEN